MYGRREKNAANPEMKCSWMTSGVITYKLCALEYACEECMFDRVMRNESAAAIKPPAVDSGLAADLALLNPNITRIDGSLFYHRSHCWVKVLSPDEVRIGINGILARLLYGIQTVVLPRPGTPVSRDQFFAHIIQEKHIVPVICPIDGEVSVVNQNIVQTPDILRLDHHEHGWLATVKPDNLEHDLQTMAFGNQAVQWYRKKDRSICEALHTASSVSNARLGPTMQDGGNFMPNNSELLPPEAYYKILEVLSASE